MMPSNDILSKPEPGELARAAKAGNTDAVKALLKRGASVEDADYFSALLYAALDNRTETVRLLLDNGARINGISNGNGPALGFAAMSGHIETVRLLLDRGADTEGKNSTHHTALILAAMHGHEDVFCLLLERGASLEAKNTSGETALDMATKNGHTYIARIIRETLAARESAAIKAAKEKAQRISHGAAIEKQQNLKNIAKTHKPKIWGQP
jgi:ankyrin repeat protein